MTVITVRTEAHQGPRRATVAGGALACRVFARDDLDRATRGNAGGAWSDCDKPGVYLLAGFEDGKRAVYIGQAGSVSERLDQHRKDQPFWRKTAVLLSGSEDDLSRGVLDYLEARLIGFAMSSASAPNSSVRNKVQPDVGRHPTHEWEECKELLDQALYLLPALGFDFFDPPAETPRTEGEAASAAPPVTARLGALLDELRAALTAGYPDSEFYSTRIDFRAKVTKDGHFRPYARIGIRKDGVFIRLKGTADVKLRVGESISPELRDQIHQAYEKAVAHLAGKWRTGRAAAGD